MHPVFFNNKIECIQHNLLLIVGISIGVPPIDVPVASHMSHSIDGIRCSQLSQQYFSVLTGHGKALEPGVTYQLPPTDPSNVKPDPVLKSMKAPDIPMLANEGSALLVEPMVNQLS